MTNEEKRAQMRAAFEVSIETLSIMCDGGFSGEDIKQRMFVVWSLGDRFEREFKESLWSDENREIFRRANPLSVSA